MRLIPAALLMVCVTATEAHECSTVDATFEDVPARAALVALAADAGYRIANPDVVTGRIDVRLQEMNPHQAFLHLSRALGYVLTIRGRDVTLRSTPT
jgi:hypothetical protein